MAVGLLVGTLVGVVVTTTVGFALGKRVGAKLGLADVAATKGFPVGTRDGDKVGTALGFVVEAMGHVCIVARKTAPFFKLRLLEPQRLGVGALVWYTRELYWSLLGYQLAFDTE